MNKPFMLMLGLLLTGIWAGASPAQRKAEPGNAAGVLGDILERASIQKTNASTQTLVSLQQHLLQNFDRWLEDPKQYGEIVKKDCSIFPEGTLYPYALPALAYANLAFSDPKNREHARRQISKLIDMAIPEVVRKVQPPGWNLLGLKDYQDHATYLGTLNLVLGTFQLVTGDKQYARLHEHLSRMLQSALIKKGGYPIESYPEYSWNLDTVVALCSLNVYDRIHGANASQALARAHLDWIKRHGTHNATGLPYSMGWNGTNLTVSPPRGCDLSMRLCLMMHFAPEEAKALYGKYVASHWIDRAIIAGFSEWPNGGSSVQDVDSGPVFLGIGSTASSMGLGASIAVGDKARERKLTSELFLMQHIVYLIATGNEQNPTSQTTGNWFSALGVKPSSKYVTGFLYGDVALFYAITWTPYPK